MEPVSTSPATPKHELRFMYFPREIRDRIYANILCDFQYSPKAPLLSSTILPAPNFEIDVLMPKASVDTAILRLNHQVHDEAKEVMIKKNKFVRIFARGLCFGPFAYEAGVRILTRTIGAAEADVESTVRHLENIATMSWYITSDDETERDSVVDLALGEKVYYNCDVVILGIELPALVRAIASRHWWAHPLHRTRTGGSTFKLPLQHHRIVIHDPCRKAEDPKYDVQKVHTSLMDPFRDNFRRMASFDIKGVIHPEFAATVVAKATSEETKTLEAILEEANILRNAGNNAFRHGCVRDAWQLYNQALSCLSIIGQRSPNAFRPSEYLPSTQHDRERMVVDYMRLFFGRKSNNPLQYIVDSFAELAFLLLRDKNQIAFDSVRALRSGGSSDGTPTGSGQRQINLENILKLAYRTCIYADFVPIVYVSKWMPTRRQKADNHLALASAGLLAGHREGIIIAHQAVTSAAIWQPDDPEIRREKRLIRRLFRDVTEEDITQG